MRRTFIVFLPVVACAVAVCTLETRGAVDTTNSLPYTNTFEGYADGYAITNANGWDVADPSVVAIVTNTLDAPTNASPYLPLDTPHTNILNNAGSSATNSFFDDGTNGYVFIDVAMKPVGRVKPPKNVGFEQDDHVRAQVAAYVNTNGHLVFMHEQDVGNYYPVWTTNEVDHVPTGAWTRVTFVMAYHSSALNNDVYFQVQVEGRAYTNATYGFSSPGIGDYTVFPDGGTWFAAANSAHYALMDGGIPKLSSVGIEGLGSIDDLVVSRMYTVNVTTTNGSGSGAISPSGQAVRAYPKPITFTNYYIAYNQVVTVHESGTNFTITPDLGSHIADVAVDGMSKGAVSAWAFTGVTNNHTMDVWFEIDTNKITATASGNGTLNGLPGTRDVWVRYNASTSFVIKGNPGYHVLDVVIGTPTYTNSIGPTNFYTFTGVVTNPYSIEAIFEIDTNRITASVASGSGALFPPSEWVPYGASSTGCVITANSGYRITDVRVDGGSVSLTNVYSITYTFAGVTTNHFIEAYFGPAYTTHGTPYSWLERHGLVTNGPVTNAHDNADTSDTDGDGMTAWQEYQAGTIPTNSESVFKILEVRKDWSVKWLGGTNEANIPFQIYRSTNLTLLPQTNAWMYVTNYARTLGGLETNVWFDIAGSNTIPTLTHVFYKITAPTNQ